MHRGGGACRLSVGHVKARHLAAAKADEAALLEQFRSGTPPLLKAAE
jgi:indolepyruvate ferredoxin oxidoreductase